MITDFQDQNDLESEDLDYGVRPNLDYAVRPLTLREVDEILKNRPPPSQAMNVMNEDEFFKAIKRSDLTLVDNYLKANPLTIQWVDAQGNTPLMVAIADANLALIDRLLTTPGIDINATNEQGFTALMKASQRGETDIVQTLLNHKADITLVNKSQHTAESLVSNHSGHGYRIENILRKEALFQAAKTGNLTALELRLSQVSGNSTNQQGDTPLIIAARQGHLHIIHALLKKRVVITSKNRAQNTADDEARLNGHTDIVKCLQNAEFFQAIYDGDPVFVELYLRDHPEAIKVVDSFGNTALILATISEHESIFNTLLGKTKKGSTINDANNFGETALMWAAEKEQLGMVQALLKKGADFYLRNNNGSTALDKAIRSRNFQVIDALQKVQGEDLLKAVTMGDLIRVQKFVAESKKIHNPIKVVDDRGNTPLLVAVFNENLDLVQSLVTVDCFVNETNLLGINALNHAVLRGNLAMVEALLSAPGIQIDAVNEESGATALIYATYIYNKNIIEALLRKKANPGIKDISQSTAEQIARNLGQDAIADMIQKAGKEWGELAMAAFLNNQVASKVSTLSVPYPPRDTDGDINPALKIFGTKQNKMENDRWEIFVLLENEAGEVGMRSGVKSETSDYNDLEVTEQFNFSLFPNPWTQEIKVRLQTYRHGHPTLALNFTKLDHDIYETLPVFCGGWLLRNDNGSQKRIQVYWSSGRYSAGRGFTPEQEHLLQLCASYHLMMEYGKDLVVEFYPHDSTSMSNFIKKNARGGKPYDWNHLVQEVNQLMAPENQNAPTAMRPFSILH